MSPGMGCAVKVLVGMDFMIVLLVLVLLCMHVARDRAPEDSPLPDAVSQAHLDLLLAPGGLGRLAAMVGRGESVGQLPYPPTARKLAETIGAGHVVFLDEDATNFRRDHLWPPEPYLATERPFKDWAANFVVNKMLGSGSENNFEFIELVVHVVEDALRAYKRAANLTDDKILLLSKGGNVLRLVWQTFLNSFQNGISHDAATDVLQARLAFARLEETYSHDFQMSYADLKVFIDTKLDAGTFERVQRDVCLLVYLAQLKIRHELQGSMARYFPITSAWAARGDGDAPRELQEWLREGMQPVVDQFTSEGDYKHLVNAKLTKAAPAENHDMILFKDAEDGRFGKFSLRPSSEMPISWNDALDFVQGDRRSTFTLVRTKFQFKVDYVAADGPSELGACGELIDINVPKRGDVSSRYFWELLHKEVERNGKPRYQNKAVATYNISQFIRGALRTLTFHSEGLLELKEDSTKMLFLSTHDRPWEFREYEKRLARLLFLSFVDLFSTFTDPAQRLSAINIAFQLVKGWMAETAFNSFTTPFLQCMKLHFGDDAAWRKYDLPDLQEEAFFVSQEACVGDDHSHVGLTWWHSDKFRDERAFFASPLSKTSFLHDIVMTNVLRVMENLIVTRAQVEHGWSEGKSLADMVEDRRADLDHAGSFLKTVVSHLDLHFWVCKVLRDFYIFSGNHTVALGNAATVDDAPSFT